MGTQIEMICWLVPWVTQPVIEPDFTTQQEMWTRGLRVVEGSPLNPWELESTNTVSWGVQGKLFTPPWNLFSSSPLLENIILITLQSSPSFQKSSGNELLPWNYICRLKTSTQLYRQAEKGPEETMSHCLDDLMKTDRWKKNESEKRPRRLITSEHNNWNSDLNKIQQ